MDLDSARDAVDAAFDAFGVDGRYDDGNGVADCRIIIRRRSKDRELPGFQLGNIKIGESATLVVVRASEAAPVSGGRFTVIETGRAYRVGEDTPMEADVHGLAMASACTVESV